MPCHVHSHFQSVYIMTIRRLCFAVVSDASWPTELWVCENWTTKEFQILPSGNVQIFFIIKHSEVFKSFFSCHTWWTDEICQIECILNRHSLVGRKAAANIVSWIDLLNIQTSERERERTGQVKTKVKYAKVGKWTKEENNVASVYREPLTLKHVVF